MSVHTSTSTRCPTRSPRWSTSRCSHANPCASCSRTTRIFAGTDLNRCKLKPHARSDALRVHRQRYIRPIANDFEKWWKAVEPTRLPSELLMTAVRYYKNHRNALFRFVDDPDVPIDKSPTERVFQTVAKLRLNMLFAGSTEGAHRACITRHRDDVPRDSSLPRWTFRCTIPTLELRPSGTGYTRKVKIC